MPRFKPLPPLADLRKKLSYCPESGVFTWLVSPTSSVKVGQVAGKSLPTGYRLIRWEGDTFYAHRLAWLFVTGEDPGPLTVDHKNRITNDNRAENLRLATQSTQNYNQGLRKDNASKAKGVHYCNSKGRWIARAWSAGRLVWTKWCRTKEEAIEARHAFMAELHPDLPYPHG